MGDFSLTVSVISSSQFTTIENYMAWRGLSSDCRHPLLREVTGRRDRFRRRPPLPVLHGKRMRDSTGACRVLVPLKAPVQLPNQEATNKNEQHPAGRVHIMLDHILAEG